MVEINTWSSRSWSGYGDELCWAALWLYRATGDAAYLDKAKNHWNEFGLNGIPGEFSWDNKNAGSYVSTLHYLTNINLLLWVGPIGIFKYFFK